MDIKSSRRRSTLAALALAGIGSGMAADAGASAQGDPLAADRAYFTAIASHPPTALEALLDEGFVYRTARGTAIGKRVLIGHLAQGLTRVAKIRSLRAMPARDGDTAVVTGVAEVTLGETAGPRTVWSRYTHVWILRDGRWRLLYREASESAGPLPDTEATADLAP